MRNFRTWMIRFVGLFRKQHGEREFAAEMESHLEMHVAENLREGMTPQAARRNALMKLGGLEQTKELYADRKGLPMLETFLQDLAYALRMLRKNPGFSAIVVLMIALGIGANTAIFSVVNAALLRPLPFAHPERIVAMYQVNQLENASISFPNLKDWQKQNRSFEALAGWREDSFNWTGAGEAERLRGLMISADFFRVLGVEPLLGRNFSSEEDRLGAAPLALVSERLWRSRLGASPEVVGRNLTLNGKDYSILGVIPSAFRWYRDNDIYIPLGQWDEKTFQDRRVSMGLLAIATLKNGTTAAQATADMKTVAASLARAYPESNAGTGVAVVPMREDAVGGLRPTLLILLGAVGFVLLIACANVANLLLARSSGRTREFAIRAAMGAGRGRVIRQVLTESVLLSAIGGGIGVLLAVWGTRAALKLLPTTLPSIVEVELDTRVMMFALGVSLLTGILFGLAPAWKISRPNMQATLKEGGRGVVPGHHGAQGVFIVSEIALALILLAGAGLMLRTLHRLAEVQLGFDPRNVITLSVAFPPAGKPNADAIREKHRQLMERISALPGVDGASVLFGSLPMNGDSELPFYLEGQPKPASDNDMEWALMYGVGPQYFKAMRIPLLRGRLITPLDTHAMPQIIVVDEEFAQKNFPGQDPLGKRVNMLILGQVQIVGVVGHVRHWGLDGDDTAKIRSQFYVPFAQFPDEVMGLAANDTNLIVRTKQPSASLVNAIRQEVTAMDHQHAIYGVQALDEIVSDSQGQRRFSMMLLSFFAGIALLLASIGIYGVVSYLVNQRVHEVGVRMALGAQPRDILRIVLGRGAAMALVGIAIGLVASFALTRLISKLLFGISATDPMTFAGVALLLLVVTLAACYVPAQRATRIDPMVALRYE
jgi:predicted permease